MGACSACHGANGEGGQGPNLVSGRGIGRLSDAQLFSVIRNGLPGTDMPPFRMADDKVWQLSSYVRSMSAPAVAMRLSGDPAKGAALFSGKGRCSGCHAIRGVGGVIGPDLTNIGGARTMHQIRQSVLDPGARIEPGYEAITCVKADGKEIRGVARNYNNYSAQVLDRQGAIHLLSRAELKSMKIEEKTLMPGGASELFSAAELADLFAFLSRQTTRSVEGDSK